MTVDDLRKILRGLPKEAEVLLAHHGDQSSLVGYSVDRKADGIAHSLTLKTASVSHKETR